MNPASASVPTASPRLVDNIARPAPTASNDSIPMAAPQVVANIPVHAPTAAAAQPSEDDELDKIMRDVGQELKKDNQKPQKKGLLSFFKKSKAKPQPPAVTMKKAPVAAQLVPEPRPILPVAPARPAARPHLEPAPAAATKVKTHKSVPAFAIFVALLVTGFLAVAAIAAYRQ